MTNWLEELETLPEKLEKPKAPIHTPDETDKTRIQLMEITYKVNRSHGESDLPPSPDASAPAGRTLKPADIDKLLEAAEERAAIMEYDGGLPKAKAEKLAVQAHITPYFFKCTDGGGTFRAECETIEEARKALEFRFGKKLIKVEQKF